MFLKIIGLLFMTGGVTGIVVVIRTPADYFTSGMAIIGMLAIIWMGYDLYRQAAAEPAQVN